jgi:hypothetical protein
MVRQQKAVAVEEVERQVEIQVTELSKLSLQN